MENETKKKRASKSDREEALAAFWSWLRASMSADRQSRRNGGFVEVAIPSAPSPVASKRYYIHPLPNRSFLG